MTSAAAGQIPPKRFEPLEAGLQTPLDTRPVSPRAGVVWALVGDGTARYFSDESLPLVPAGLAVPLTSEGWLDPVSPASFTGLDTTEVLRRDLELHGLQFFHHCVIARLNRETVEDEARERARALRRDRSSAQRMNQAIRALASPLNPEARTLATASDPWLACCRMAGEFQNIPFAAVPDRRASESHEVESSDPITAICRASGVRFRSVLLNEGWWKQEHGPLVARRESDRAPVALLPAPGGYWYCDPATNSRQAMNAELAASLEPFAWSFYRPFPAGKMNAAGLVRFGLSRCQSEIATMVLAGVGAAVVAMALPLATGYAFDDLIPGSQRSQLSIIASILVVVTVCSSLFQLARAFALQRLESKMDAAVQAAIWDRLLELPAEFFRRFTAGDLASRGLGIQAVREVLTGSAVSSMLGGVFGLFSFALLFYYDSTMALVAAGLTALAFLFVALCGYWQTRCQRRLADLKGQLSGLTLQVVNGIAKIRVSAAESRVFSVWARLFSEQRQIAVKSRTVSNWMAVFNAAYPVLCTLIIFLVFGDKLETALKGAAAVKGAADAAPPMTTGQFIGFTTAFAQLLQSALGLAAALISVVAVAPAYERAKPILQTPPETDRNKSQPEELTGDLEVRHLSFRYGKDVPLVLNNVSLKISPGQFVAMVGPSGSGKSTLLRMLLGFDKPETGSVYYDQRDLSNLDVHAVRRQVGVVLQNGRIRAGSIHKNIVGTASLTVEDAWAAARMAGFDADIEMMPMGMQTILGEGGGTLSGGQRQRLLIARALVRRPRIIFFDEATSALDNHTQAVVSRSLDNLRATRVVIAHRLTTIERADRIFVLVKGRLVQEGSYRELMSQEGAFADLAKRQLT
jgi:NHLM bacteriocin system ABC transporter ATP-binding protein